MGFRLESVLLKKILSEAIGGIGTWRVCPVSSFLCFDYPEGILVRNLGIAQIAVGSYGTTVLICSLRLVEQNLA